VRNIYNSRIIVLRPNPNINWPYPNVEKMYGEIAFCEISAPAGCRCIGTVMPGATICDNNILSCPGVIPTVPCPGLGPGQLIVTMPCAGSTVYGSPPTFTATTNKDADFTFYLDNVLQKSESGLSAEFIPNVSVSVGEHQVCVVATSGNETSDKTCQWHVNVPLAEPYLLTIIGGTIDDGTPVASKMVPAGSVVYINANAPQPDHEFVMWNPHDHTNVFGDQLAATTTFVMPDHDVTVTAAFRSTTQIVINPNQANGTYTGYSLSTHALTGMKMVNLSHSYERFSFAPNTLVDNVRYFYFYVDVSHPGAVIDFTGVNMGTEFLGFAGNDSRAIDISNLVVKIDNINSFSPFNVVRNVTNVDIECNTIDTWSPIAIIGNLFGEIKNSRLVSYRVVDGTKVPHICIYQIMPTGRIGPGNSFSCSER
jgi:hypothetical protein